MRALVTGGAGFTGVHLVRELLKWGHHVTILDITRGTPKVAAELERRGVRFVVASLADPAALDRSVPGHDVVFNLASAFRDIHHGAPLFQEVDVEGTRCLLETARRENVRRVVHCSTQGVHGSLRKGSPPGNEDSPIAPIDYYCEAKADAERICEEFIAEGADIVIVRPTSIYGPGDTHGWLKLFRACRKGHFVMIGSGETRNHPVFAMNLARAFLLAAEMPEARGRTYLIGDEGYVTLNELVKAVGRVQGRDVRMIRFPWYWPVHAVAWAMEMASRPFGIEPPIFRRRLTWYTTDRAWDLTRAKTELGYAPEVNLEEGLQKTLEWYESEGLL
jgi:dihydroflavonol-4-reductase